MATTKINSVRVVGNQAILDGTGPANTKIYVAQSGSGMHLGQGETRGDGLFTITTIPLLPGNYTAVVGEMVSGLVNNNNWSNEAMFQIV
ncbi:hypothetical protein IAI51_17925 [Pseudomonas sp. N40(2020)]|uniref:hypothetical protein n=1 Tax=Pseudomonas sp. N40(2020) TaxID=2767798 RepID=UPI0016570CF4|nr:hypothetical protein [Pseudomonas sp. N40(2020)]MBC8998412.1 hypothetical protein [Pseudomonas sp. N40(2020)]